MFQMCRPWICFHNPLRSMMPVSVYMLLPCRARTIYRPYYFQFHLPILHEEFYNSFSPPVTRSTKLLGAGPTPSTVRLSGLICVRPASWITSDVIPRLRALPINSSSSSSDFTCTAILAWPRRSQRCRSLASGDEGLRLAALVRVL